MSHRDSFFSLAPRLHCVVNFAIIAPSLPPMAMLGGAAVRNMMGTGGFSGQLHNVNPLLHLDASVELGKQHQQPSDTSYSPVPSSHVSPSVSIQDCDVISDFYQRAQNLQIPRTDVRLPQQ